MNNLVADALAGHTLRLVRTDAPSLHLQFACTLGDWLGPAFRLGPQEMARAWAIHLSDVLANTPGLTVIATPEADGIDQDGAPYWQISPAERLVARDGTVTTHAPADGTEPHHTISATQALCIGSHWTAAGLVANAQPVKEHQLPPTARHRHRRGW